MTREQQRRRPVLPASVEDYTDDAWGDTDSLTALRELTEAAASVRPAIARRAGISESELLTLEHLFAGPIGPAEVARRLGVSTAASTSIIDRLAARGHVEKHPHATDRRRTDVGLTDSGRLEVLAQLMPMFRALEQMDAELGDDERVLVAAYLRRATAALRTVL